MYVTLKMPSPCIILQTRLPCIFLCISDYLPNLSGFKILCKIRWQLMIMTIKAVWTNVSEVVVQRAIGTNILR